MPPSTDRILVLANARAGSAAEASVQAALTVLRRHAEVELVRDGPGTSLEPLARTAGRRWVVIGGDGSVHHVVGGLHRLGRLRDVTIGIVPLGTGNDLARSLGLPFDPGAAAEVAVTGRERALEALVDDTGTVVVNAMHLGVGAEAARSAEAWKPRFGLRAYRLGGLLAGIRARGTRLRVEADGEVVADLDRRLLMVGLAIGRTIGGGGATLAPDAVLGDGRAELVLVWAVGPFARAGYALRLRRGTHPTRDDVQIHRVRAVSVHGQPFTCNSDGELTGPVMSRSWRVEPGAWRVVVPG